MTMTLHRGELGEADVRALLARHQTALRDAAPPGGSHVLWADGLREPAITFFSARGSDGRLLGIAALKSLGEGEGEIKSMRVDDSALGTGAGRFLLTGLIAEARERAYHTMRLETGRDPLFEAAIGLYRAAGFVETGRYGEYPDHPYKLFMTRAL
jgi:putative acetyltransferase